MRSVSPTVHMLLHRYVTDVQLPQQKCTELALNLPSPTNTGRPRRLESPVCLNPDERLAVLEAARARTAAQCQQSSDAWSQLNVTSPVALEVTSPTPENLTGGHIEPETVGDKDRIHHPGDNVDDTSENDTLEDSDDNLEAHHSSGSEKLDSEDPAPTPNSHITIDMRIQMA